MDPTSVAAGAKDHPRPSHHHHHQLVSPRGSHKNLQPPTPSCGAQGHQHPQGGGAAVPKCVCAPTTHAGSFKCRLHRTNSHGHSAPSTPPSPRPSAPASRSIEAV